MTNIQDSAWPLVFAVDPDSFTENRLRSTGHLLHIRTSARALEGMQKEAVVEYGDTGRIWRMVCDEGPYLNGTDLAPFPLGFFAAGLTASYMSAYLAEAKDRDITINTLRVFVDNYYSMEGSALRGTMKAGVQPTTVRFEAGGDASDGELEDIGEVAVIDRSPVTAVLRSALHSAFSIRGNDALLQHSLFPAPTMGALSDPLTSFDQAQPVEAESSVSTIIQKAEHVAKAPDDGGPPVGLQADQKRMLHVHAEGQLRKDGLKEITARCIQPESTAFTFLSDDSRLFGGQERAPSGLSYLAAGVVFCFMTQLGRYAQIAKQNLASYRVVQDTTFDIRTVYEPKADSVQTLVCVDANEPDDNIIKLVQMGEQTCYLHGAYRLPTETKIISAYAS